MTQPMKTIGEIRHDIEVAWGCQLGGLDSIRGITHVGTRGGKVVAWFNIMLPQMVFGPHELWIESRTINLASQIPLLTDLPYILVCETLTHTLWAKVFRKRADYPVTFEDQIHIPDGWQIIPPHKVQKHAPAN